jgi:predicted enzyme related to lactoylglutathione lyase
MTIKNTAQGRFVWHELATHDVKGAEAFYSELFAWKPFEVEAPGHGKYTMLKCDGKDVGGIAKLSANDASPPHWRSFCWADDLDATVRKAKELGGTIVVPPTEMPGFGSFAAIKDSQGAVLMPWHGKEAPPELEGPPPVGSFCWDELLTTDTAAAAKFYKELYGYTVEEKNMGPMGTYRVLKRGDRETAGIMSKPMAEVPTHWTAYVHVVNVDESAKRAERLKATIAVQPMDIPGIGRFAVLVDPSHASIPIFQGVAR